MYAQPEGGADAPARSNARPFELTDNLTSPATQLQAAINLTDRSANTSMAQMLVPDASASRGLPQIDLAPDALYIPAAHSGKQSDAKQQHHEKPKPPQKHHHSGGGLFGAIGGAFSSAVHGVEHVASDAVHGVEHAAANVVHGVEHVASDVEHVAAGAVHQTVLFGEGVVTGAVLDPINGVTQLVNHVAGTHIGAVELPNQKEVNASWAGKIGEMAGQGIDFAALTVATGGVGDLAGVGLSTAARAGIAGLVDGTVLTPSDPNGHGSFWEQRFEHGLLDGGLGAAAGFVSDAVTPAIQNAASGVIGKVGAEGTLSQVQNAARDGLERLGVSSEWAERLTGSAAGEQSIRFVVRQATKKTVSLGEGILGQVTGSGGKPAQAVQDLAGKGMVGVAAAAAKAGKSIVGAMEKP